MSVSPWQRLVDDGLISAEELRRAELRLGSRGGAFDSALLESASLDGERRRRLTSALVSLLGRPLATDAELAAAPADGLSELPRADVLTYALVPLSVRERPFVVAAPALPVDTLALIAARTGGPVEWRFALELELRRTLSRLESSPLAPRFEALEDELATVVPASPLGILRRSLRDIDSAWADTGHAHGLPLRSLAKDAVGHPASRDWVTETLDRLASSRLETEWSSLLTTITLPGLDAAMFFRLHDDQLLGIAGSETGRPMDRLPGLEVPTETVSVLGRAATRGATRCGRYRTDVAFGRVYSALGRAAPVDVLVTPVSRGGRVIGVVLGDHATHAIAPATASDVRRLLVGLADSWPTEFARISRPQLPAEAAPEEEHATIEHFESPRSDEAPRATMRETIPLLGLQKDSVLRPLRTDFSASLSPNRTGVEPTSGYSTLAGMSPIRPTVPDGYEMVDPSETTRMWRDPITVPSLPAIAPEGEWPETTQELRPMGLSELASALKAERSSTTREAPACIAPHEDVARPLSVRPYLIDALRLDQMETHSALARIATLPAPLPLVATPSGSYDPAVEGHPIISRGRYRLGSATHDLPVPAVAALRTGHLDPATEVDLPALRFVRGGGDAAGVVGPTFKSEAFARERGLPVSPMSDDDVGAAVRHLQRSEAPVVLSAIETLLAAGEAGLDALVRVFPGPLVVDRFAHPPGRPPVEEHGGVLRALTHFSTLGEDSIATLCVDSIATLCVDRIEALCADVSPEIRYYAVFLFSAIRSPRSVPLIVERAHDADSAVRDITLFVLGQYRGTPAFDSAVELLRAALRDGPLRHRRLVIEAVSRLRIAASIPELCDLLGEKNQGLYDGVYRALCEITRADLGLDAWKWMRWYERHRARPRVEWLLDGLVSEQRAIRAGALSELRKLTHQNYGFVVDAPPAERRYAHERWVRWWSETGHKRFSDYE